MIKTPLSTVIGGAFWTPKATILGGASKTFNQLIKSLFANNEQGFAYDPNDLTTMFQDAAGTVPVTGAGQPVGLLLDKSRGLVLGPEKLVNGDFSNGSANWAVLNSDATHVITFANEKVRFQSDTTTPVLSISQANVYEIDKWYEVTVVCSSYVSGALKMDAGNGGVVIAAGLGTFKTKILARTTTLNLVRNTANVDITIDSISVKEIAGNHAYQTTSSMRPLLAASPQRLDYDIADDKLITTLPAQLTGCTVVRSVPNVGTQILTNQTIPATYNDNTDHCGLIVINRALTATETSQITKLFNKAAGV